MKATEKYKTLFPDFFLAFQNEWMCKAYTCFTTGQGDSTFTNIDNHLTEWFIDHLKTKTQIGATGNSMPYLEIYNHGIDICLSSFSSVLYIQ